MFAEKHKPSSDNKVNGQNKSVPARIWQWVFSRWSASLGMCRKLVLPKAHIDLFWPSQRFSDKTCDVHTNTQSDFNSRKTSSFAGQPTQGSTIRLRIGKENLCNCNLWSQPWKPDFVVVKFEVVRPVFSSTQKKKQCSERQPHPAKKSQSKMSNMTTRENSPIIDQTMHSNEPNSCVCLE